MGNNQKTTHDALLDGLVFARDILWSLGDYKMLSLLQNRLKTRYDVELWELRSPVEGDSSLSIKNIENKD